MSTAKQSRTRARTAAAKTVVATWDTWADNPVDTNDPQFWTKYADNDEAMADAYRALNRLTDDRGVAMALQDAEEFRRERAKGYRRNAEAAGERAAGSREEVSRG